MTAGRLRRPAGALLLLLASLTACTSAAPETRDGQGRQTPADAGPPTARHVDPDGDDDAAGTAAAPWEHLETALERLRPGDELVVHEGTYDEDLEPALTPGRPGARVLVRAAAGEDRPVVKGLVRLTRPDHWTVRGLDLTWGGGGFDDHMVKVSGGEGWVLEDLRIHGSRSRAGLLIAQSVDGGPPRDYVLRDSAVYDSKRGANLYLNPGLGSSGGLVERNLFFDSPTENVKIGFGGSCADQEDPLNGAAGVVLRHNTLSDAEQPLTVAEPAADVLVHDNIVVGSRGSALLRLDGQCGNLGDGIVVRDNLGFDADRWCFEADSPLTCADVDRGGLVFPRDPDFDDEDVDGFRPRDETARTFGRYAG